MPAQTVYLVSCVSKKRRQRSAARDLYTSDWFQKARSYVETQVGKWFILSAEYGLVEPETQIDWYEKTLNTMPIANRRVWAEKVLSELDQRIPCLSRVVFLAGLRYREFLVKPLQDRGVEVEVPMEGLQIGKQLQWLAENTVAECDS